MENVALCPVSLSWPPEIVWMRCSDDSGCQVRSLLVLSNHSVHYCSVLALKIELVCPCFRFDHGPFTFHSLKSAQVMKQRMTWARENNLSTKNL